MPFVDAHKCRLYYQSIGEGPAILFAHGAGGNAASWWQQQPYFLPGHQLITFDQRSFGRSVCAPDDFDPQHFADDLHRILDATGVEKAALVCQSMGGWGGLAFSRRYPERVPALVMSHTFGGITNDAIRHLARQSRENLPEIQTPFGSWATAVDFPQKKPELANLYNQLADFNMNDRERVVSALLDPRARVEADTLNDFLVPTLFVTADQDVLIPPAIINEAAKILPDAEVVNLGQVGHSSYFETANDFNQVVGEFLSRHNW